MSFVWANDLSKRIHKNRRNSRNINKYISEESFNGCFSFLSYLFLQSLYLSIYLLYLFIGLSVYGPICLY